MEEYLVFQKLMDGQVSGEGILNAAGKRKGQGKGQVARIKHKWVGDVKRLFGSRKKDRRITNTPTEDKYGSR